MADFWSTRPGLNVWVEVARTLDHLQNLLEERRRNGQLVGIDELKKQALPDAVRVDQAANEHDGVKDGSDHVWHGLPEPLRRCPR